MSSKVKSPKTRGHGKASVAETNKKPQNVFKVLPELVCENLLKINNLGELEELLLTNLKIEEPDTNLKSALLIEFYLTVIIWIKESFQLDLVKFSLIFSGIYYLVENIKNKQTNIKNNIEELNRMLLHKEQMSETSFEGVFGNLDAIELIKVNQFLQRGIFQHYKLFEYVFSYHRAQNVIGTDLSIETLPLNTSPYPAPLCEAIDSNLYNECFAPDGSIRSHSAKSGEFNDEDLEADLDRLDREMDSELSEFAGLTLSTITVVLREECNNVFMPASSEMELTIQDIESSFLKRINKSPKV